jgi:FkbM family methyltransferase
MRIEDFHDYFALRRFTLNPWEVLRFRKHQKEGDLLTVRLKRHGPLHIRGGRTDFHMFHRIYLRDEYRLGNRAAGSWNCVVDLGANVGLFSARASEIARKVVAYEPFPENFACLEKNVAPRENVEPVREAVAGETGVLKLFRPRNESNSGSYSSFAYDEQALSEEYDEVPAVTLDTLFDRHAIDRCDLLKMDVEGSEYEILYSASDATLARIERIHGEYHNVRPEDPGTRIQNLAAYLESKDFIFEKLPHRRKENHGLFFARRPGGA